MRGVNGPLAGGQTPPAAAEGDADGAAGALITLVRPAGQAGIGQGVDDAVGTGGFDVVDGAGQGGRGPQQPTVWIGDHLHVHAVLPMFSRVERPVGGDAVDRQQRPVENCLTGGVPEAILVTL
jgi:hypothetical protein